MTRADGRPRVHLWPSQGRYWTYSLGATGMHQGGGTDAGEQLNRALSNLGDRAAKGVVVIVEPVP